MRTERHINAEFIGSAERAAAEVAYQQALYERQKRRKQPRGPRSYTVVAWITIALAVALFWPLWMVLARMVA